ncbi:MULTISPECIES: sigma-70 family RNA polymerase sigma factor [Agrobacterium]|uniref:Sigma-70 family RNA polymerase sigma factor n=2 Tax=Agrobacterium rosae TaxID=1972867 RepID=A0A1R3TU20_9HYPH|nr:sigma-70 family RNA polymerase sigma factor [Agrobacterium rosae]MDX8303789.1 sigma-70 family RNA polymerase sigma factor [Agrobacterium rosae]MDX8329538.1 sigma-70 family RNA polymerase sigma factor [Agrobacterium rosae]SCX20608.1 Sigma-K factor [Agrobacterium sp. DSM 25558]SCX20792.1 Sigma-K factor [Agrobacterium rosae]
MTINVSIAAPAWQYMTRERNSPVAGKLFGSGVKPIRMNDIAKNNIESECPALIRAVASERSVEAFETLFRYYGPRVRTYMLRQVRDAQAAEELMQETMITVWNKAALFDPARGNVSAWIFRIARNLRIDAHRKNKRPEFDFNDPAFVKDDAPAADTQLEEVQDAQRLHRALAQLPQEQLDLLKRSFFDEVSHSAIAEQLGLPVGTVKSRIRLAFAKLRTALESRT